MDLFDYFFGDDDPRAEAEANELDKADQDHEEYVKRVGWNMNDH